MFTGLSAFPLTPLRDDKVDEAAYAGLVERLADAGVDSITALGSTGAYAYLTPEERRRVARIALAHAGDVPVLVGVGALRTSHVLDLARDAEQIGAAGLLVAPVSYQPLTEDDVFGLYEDLSAAVSLPVIVYDNPGTTHFAFSDALYSRVAQLPTVASIKIPGVPSDPETARSRIERIRAGVPERVTIGVSGDAAAATGLNAGCEAWYSVIAGTLPEPALAITRAALSEDPARAVAESERLQPLWNLFAEYGGSFRVVAAIAELAALVGPDSIPRPLRGLDSGARRRVAEVVRGLDLIPTRIMNAPARGGLARYVLAATLARTADGGGVVAIVLLVTTSGAPGWEAGLLGASITAPHLLGPFVARRLDTARDGRNVIALACMLHGATLATAVLLFPVVWPGITAAILVASGLIGPLLTGGISSRLPAIAGQDQKRQRRAQGWDVATYGLGGTIGPSVVAAISAWASPTLAAIVLGAATFVAAAFVRLLPHVPPAAAAGSVPRPLRTLGVMLSSGPLRRTLYLTVIVALSVAVLPVTAVASTRFLGVPAATAGLLTAAYGLGNLAGSAGVMVRPPRTEADPLMTRLAAAVAVALILVAASGTAAFALVAYALAGILNAYFFAATLAARNEYSPAAAKGQVYVWVGALKITAGSAGTATAGVLVGRALHLPIILACTLTLVAVVASFIERRAETRIASRRDDLLDHGRDTSRNDRSEIAS